MKSDLNDLHIFGGPRLFDEALHVGRPNVGDRARLLDRISTILDRRWLTNNGPYVLEFEREIARLAGVKHCVATCNATVALEIAIRALDLSGEVIVPSFTFVATAHALQWQGLTPIFGDVSPRSPNLDPHQVEQLITPATTGIVAVHVWGLPCDVEALTGIARRHRLRLLFDAAHALGCSYHGKMIGGFGDAEVFSFHATKFLNSFEGGAIVTDDDVVAEKARLMRNFGFAGYDHVVSLGTNAKMHEVSAAMGLTSLESTDRFIRTNRENYQIYQRELASTPGISVVAYDALERCNYQYVVIEVDGTVAGLSRDLLHKILWSENVLARRYFYPGCHQMEPYRSHPRYTGLTLPNTDRLASRVLSLPTGTAVSVEAVKEICQLIRLIVTNGREVSQRTDRVDQVTQSATVGFEVAALAP